MHNMKNLIKNKQSIHILVFKSFFANIDEMFVSNYGIYTIFAFFSITKT